MRASEPVNRVMSASVVWIDVEAPAREVLRIFAEYPVHHLPVVKDGVVVGMLSSADLMKLKFFLPPEGPGRDRLLEDRFRVSTLMRTPVVTVSEHESVEGAAELMASNAIHSLPVVNLKGRLIGIITTTDIIAAFLRGAESKASTGGGGAASEPLTPAWMPERVVALEHVIHEARRYLNAGQDERLHAALMKAIERVDRIDEQRTGHQTSVLGLGAQ